MRTLLRILKFSFQSIWRNAWLSFVTLTIFLLTLLTINAVLFLNLLADGAISAIEDKVQVAVYFNPGTSEDIEGAVREYLLSLPQVKTVDSVTAEEALADFKERHASDPTILSALDEVGGNPFGNAVLISANDPDDFAFILEAVQKPEFAESIKQTNYTNYQAAIASITAMSDRVRVAGYALAGFFALVAILIIFNSIRVAVYVHRDEIGIMKLVGAHDWFVRAPFLVEALLLTTLATSVIAGSVLLVAKKFNGPIMEYFGTADLNVWAYFTDNWLLVFGGQFLVLTVLALFTTAFAMRKHLRV